MNNKNFYNDIMNYKRFYIPNSLLFITIVANNRMPILIDNIALVKGSFKNVSQYYEFELIAYAVLKDHIHCIIKPNSIEEYPKIVKSFKYAFTKKFKVGLVNPTYNNTNIGRLYQGDKNKNNGTENIDIGKHYYADKNNKLWQSRYWAHVIIDENDLQRHLDYIHYNPVKHYQIAPKDWEYSSFEKYVEKGFYELDWCNFEDKNNIKDLDFE